MATFTYKAATPSGVMFDGQIDGDEERDVRSKLERDGYIVLDLQSREKKASRSGAIRFGGKLPIHEVLVFNQELRALLKAGLAVLRVWGCFNGVGQTRSGTILVWNPVGKDR
jgi:type II secretory pathway component PulF